MKNIFLSIGLSFLIANPLNAANSTAQELNSVMTDLLSIVKNEKTDARLTIDDIEIDTEHVTKLALNGIYNKIGSHNTLTLKIDNLSYDYGDGSAPTTTLKGFVGLDITKTIPQDKINQIIPQAAELIKELPKQVSERFRDAISLRAVVTSTSKDEQGNYTGLSALISFKVDPTKLPDGGSNTIVVSEAVAALSIDLKKGISLEAYAISDPNSPVFLEDNIGLKQLIEKLLAHDEYTLFYLSYFIDINDKNAETIVNYDPTLNTPLAFK